MSKKNMMRTLIVFVISISIILCLFLLVFCTKQQTEITYYYSVVSDGESIPKTYLANIIQEKDGIRKISQYRYSTYKNEIVDTLVEYFKLQDNVLYKLKNENDTKGEQYLTIRNKDCVVFNYPDSVMNYVLKTKHCYLGKKAIKAGNVSDSIQAFSFMKEVGQFDNVISKAYYSKSFILVREEYLRGLCPPFRKELVDSIPDGFLALLNRRYF